MKLILRYLNIILNQKKIITEEIDYYHSNVIARASKTMSECKNIRMSLPKTGTDN